MCSDICPCEPGIPGEQGEEDIYKKIWDQYDNKELRSKQRIQFF